MGFKKSVMRNGNSEVRNGNSEARNGNSEARNGNSEMRNGNQENLYPISHMASEKWEVGLKRGFPFLKYPTLVQTIAPSVPFPVFKSEGEPGTNPKSKLRLLLQFHRILLFLGTPL